MKSARCIDSRADPVLDRDGQTAIDPDQGGATIPAALLSGDQAGASVEARFRGVLQSSSVWYWELDRNYRFVASHFDLAESNGKGPAGYLGKIAWEFDFCGVAQVEVDRWKATLLARKPFRDLIYLRQRMDGEYRWACSHGKPIFDEDGRFHGYRGLGQDITERKQAEQRQSIQTAVTRALADACTIDSAMSQILCAFGEFMAWDYGAWWPYDVQKSSFRCTQIWCRPHLQTSSFAAFAAADGPASSCNELLRRTVDTQTPQWILDIAADPALVRRAAALAAGLNGAFAFPVIERGRVLGVIELFAKRIFSPDLAITDAAVAVGHQIGQFIVRRQAEQRYRELVERSPDGIVIQCEGRVVFANSAVARLLRADGPREIIGRPVLDFVHRDARSEVLKQIGQAAKDQSVIPLQQVRGVRLDGSEGVAELSMGYVEFDGKPAIQAIVRDVTERREAERKIHRLTNLYAALSRTSEAITRLETQREVFDEVCRIAVQFGRFAMAGIGLVDPQTRRFSAAAAAGSNAFFMSLDLALDADTAEGQGPTATAVREGTPYICQDVAVDPRTAPWRTEMLESGFHSSVNVPLRRAGEVIGALVLYARHANYFDDDLLELVLKMGMNVSFALDAMEKERQRRQAEQALEEKQRALSALISNLPGMAYRCRNDRDWTMEFVSDGCYELTGYRAPDLIGNRSVSYNEIIDPQDREHVWHEVQQAGKDGYVLRYRIVTAQGETRWVWEKGQPVHDAQGRVVALEGIIVDVSSQVTTEKLLVERNQQLRLALDSSDQGLWDWNVATGRVYRDATTARILGYPAVEMEGGTEIWRDALHRDDAPSVLEALRQHLSRGSVAFQTEYRLVQPNGEVVFASTRGRVIERGPNGCALRMVGTIQDISQRKHSEDRLAFLAQYDVLTGLPNRGLFRDRLSLAISRAKRNRTLLGLLFLDLDRFNEVNDTLGHAVGDRVLQKVSARLRENLREVDTIARLSGDEFTLIVEEASDPAQLNLLAEKVRGLLSAPLTIDEHEIFLTPSLGITVYPRDAEDPEELLKNADIALYRAKRQGGNGHVFYSSDMATKSLQRLSLESELRRALERDEFVVHFQPKIDVNTLVISGAEALVRWNSRKGMISPADFIPIAEENGLILEIGAWVMEQACAQAVRWQSEGLPPLHVAVNLSPRQFMQKDLLETIAGVLARTGLSPRDLELEITESMIMQQRDSVIETLSRLSALGIRLAIDDFGTGYSSLAYLKRFPVQDIKIDRSFVRGIPGDPDDAAIVTAIVSMAKSLGLRLIAEGVESHAQFEFLRSLGCDTAQGFLFSRPIPAAEFAQLMLHGELQVPPRLV